MTSRFAAFCVAIIATTPVFAQLAQSPVVPGVTVTPRPLPLPTSTFTDLTQFFAHVAALRGPIASVDPGSAAAALQARSPVEQLRGSSGEAIVVVKVGVPSAEGNYPFYVMRETPRGLLLLGEMSGRSYHPTTERGILELIVDVSGSDAPVTPARYQVDGYFLVNLADLAGLERNDPVQPDWKRAF